MALTYEKITTYTVTGSPVSNFTMSSIPATYTDLRAVLVSTAGAAFSDEVLIRINGDAGSNYSMTVMGANGSGIQSSQRANVAQWHIDNNSPSNTNGTYFMDFMNYSNTTTYKTMVNFSGGFGNNVAASINLWRSTAAISSLYFFLASNLQYQVGTTITLYGIKAA